MKTLACTSVVTVNTSVQTVNTGLVDGACLLSVVAVHSRSERCAISVLS